MKTVRLFSFIVVLLVPTCITFYSTSFAQQDNIEQSVSDLCLSVVAEASSSYVSGDTSLEALNDGYQPRSSRDRRRGSYGNWPRRGTQWVQYEWSKPISTNKIDVYWWDDRRGVRLPEACRLLYWNGQAFTPVLIHQGWE